MTYFYVGLQVIDLIAETVVACTEETVLVSYAEANPFNRSISLGMSYAKAMIFDKDMSLVQTLSTDGMWNAKMIDEFTICGREGEKLVVYDIRKLHPHNRQILIDDVHDNHFVDVRNQRLLVTTGPYDIVGQIDLKTRKWERVWQPLGDPYRHKCHINYKYMIYTQPVGYNSAKLIAYDFST
jgi:hypothetical protein